MCYGGDNCVTGKEGMGEGERKRENEGGRQGERWKNDEIYTSRTFTK